MESVPPHKFVASPPIAAKNVGSGPASEFATYLVDKSKLLVAVKRIAPGTSSPGGVQRGASWVLRAIQL